MELFEPLQLDDFDEHTEYVKTNYIDRDVTKVNLGELKSTLEVGLRSIIKIEFDRYREVYYA